MNSYECFKRVGVESRVVESGWSQEVGCKNREWLGVFARVRERLVGGHLCEQVIDSNTTIWITERCNTDPETVSERAGQ